jgi:2-polyprenyl-3-methyl-5-hydroxy-6-metoxy-1,4-benzoquinol methylase
MTSGGYEAGYERCPCFWGTEPGSLLKALSELYDNSFGGLRVLDVGCGEGKNAYFLASRGAQVRAIDLSQKAISNGQLAFGFPAGLKWEVGDVRRLSSAKGEFDIVIAYGLLHCLESKDQIYEIISELKRCTADNGTHVLCTFNDRDQDLSAHPGFAPTLLSHSDYLDAYSGWELLHASDSDLVETHPHNLIEHHHSMTRMIARYSA